MNEPPTQDTVSASGTPAAAPPSDYRCQVCARQDETLRVVAYPFVISLVVVTFRRVFSGLWCRRHQLRYQSLAGLITAGLGWFGIPFGFIFTPVTLWKLARGGEAPAGPNQAMLKGLAELKLHSGDREGAMRCLEQALRLGEDAEAKAALGARAGYESSRFTSPPRQTALRFAAALGAALGLGFLAGALDYSLAWLSSSLVGEEVSIYVLILTWVPLVALAAAAGLILFQIIEWALGSSRIVSMPLGLCLALFAAALAAYAIPLGRGGADLVSFTVSPGMTLSPIEWLFTAGQWLTRGGVWILQDSAQSGNLSGTIYLGIVAASALYLLSGSVGAARRSVAWQRRVAVAVRLERPSAGLAGWAAMGAVAVLAAALTAVFSLPPALLTSSPAVVQHNQAGVALLDAGDLDGAIEEFELALQLEPESIEALTGLGMAHMGAGRLTEAEQALAEAALLDPSDPVAHFGRGVIDYLTGDLITAEAELQTALEVAPAFPAAHQVLGKLRSILGDSEGAVLHFEEAIRLDSTYGDAYTDLALARLRRGEFGVAADLARSHLQVEPNSPDAHAVLSMTQRRLGQVDQAEASLRQAESLASQSTDVQALVLAFMDLNQYDRAEAYQVQASQGVGWLGYHSLTMADLYIAQGKLDLGLQAIELAASLHADPVVVSERRSEAYVEMEDLDAALDELNRAVQVPPERWSVYAGLARIHLYQGESKLAEREARYALGLAPFEAGLHTILSLALLAQDLTDEAEAEALEAIRLDPLRDLPHYALGGCYLNRGQEEQARFEYEQFLKLYWDRAYVRDYRAEVEQYLDGTP